MKKINELTKGQEIDLQNSLRHWLSVGLDTKPVNPIEAEKAIGDLYTWGGLKKPARIDRAQWKQLSRPARPCKIAETVRLEF